MFVSLQAVFLAQSSMLLPEIMLSLFTVWTLYFYLKRKPLPFLVSGILLLATKESGVFLILVIWLFDFIYFLARKGKRPWKRQIIWLAILAIPAVVYMAFLIIQKLTYGWFLYPEHITLITSFRTGMVQLGIYARYFFILDARVWLTSAFVTALVITLVFRLPVTGSEKRSMLLMFLFIVFFITVHSFLVLSPRYLLCANIVMAMVSAFFTDLCTRRLPLVNILVPVIISVMLLNVSLHERNPGDTDLGYVDSVNLQKMAVNYLEANQLTKRRIYADFIFRRDMVERSAGYLSGEPFTNLKADPGETPDFIIGSNIIYDDLLEKNTDYRLMDTIRYFKSGWMEVTIYGKKQFNK
jgi:hypothetical protein